MFRMNAIDPFYDPHWQPFVPPPKPHPKDDTPFVALIGLVLMVAALLILAINSGVLQPLVPLG